MRFFEIKPAKRKQTRAISKKTYKSVKRNAAYTLCVCNF